MKLHFSPDWQRTGGRTEEGEKKRRGGGCCLNKHHRQPGQGIDGGARKNMREEYRMTCLCCREMSGRGCRTSVVAPLMSGRPAPFAWIAIVVRFPCLSSTLRAAKNRRADHFELSRNIYYIRLDRNTWLPSFDHGERKPSASWKLIFSPCSVAICTFKCYFIAAVAKKAFHFCSDAAFIMERNFFRSSKCSGSTKWTFASLGIVQRVN